MFRHFFPGDRPEPGMKFVSTIQDHVSLRLIQLRQPPFWKLPYKHMVDDGIDWLFLRGKYKDEFKNANRHMLEKRDEPEPAPVKAATAWTFNDVKDIDMAIIVALVFRLSQSCRSALAVESGSNGISNNMLTFQEPINTI